MIKNKGIKQFASVKLLIHIKDSYDLKSMVKKQLFLLECHLNNMNILFNDICRGMKDNAYKVV